MSLPQDINATAVRVQHTSILPRLAVAPEAPLKGALAFNTPDDHLYFADGTTWHKILDDDDAFLAGDATGPLLANTVVGIRGVTISVVAPANGQVLALVGGVWTPTAPSGLVTLAGDVTGNATANTVVKLQSRNMSAAAPAVNDVLTWTGAAWAPAPAAGIVLGGDVTGPAGANTVVRLQNRDMDALAPNTTLNQNPGTQFLGWDTVNFGTPRWAPLTPTISDFKAQAIFPPASVGIHWTTATGLDTHSKYQLFYYQTYGSGGNATLRMQLSDRYGGPVFGVLVASNTIDGTPTGPIPVDNSGLNNVQFELTWMQQWPAAPGNFAPVFHAVGTYEDAVVPKILLQALDSGPFSSLGGNGIADNGFQLGPFTIGPYVCSNF